MCLLALTLGSCDRFNPQIHEQAICRTYRIGQKKDVYVSPSVAPSATNQSLTLACVQVTYLDAQDTFDELIKGIMNKKNANSEAVLKLAGGVEIGRGGGNGLGYQEIRDTFAGGLQQIINNRTGEADAQVFQGDANGAAAGPAPAGGGGGGGAAAATGAAAAAGGDGAFRGGGAAGGDDDMFASYVRDQASSASSTVA